jgi:cytochrome-b5 reductase
VDGLPRIRLYSPLQPQDHTARELVLLVKRYEKGNISKHIFSLKEGDVLSIKGPNLKYPYKSQLWILRHFLQYSDPSTVNQFEEVAFIGGGTGM